MMCICMSLRACLLPQLTFPIMHLIFFFPYIPVKFSMLSLLLFYPPSMTSLPAYSSTLPFPWWPMTLFSTLHCCMLVKMHPLCSALCWVRTILCVNNSSCATVHLANIITCVLFEWSPGTAQGHFTQLLLPPDCVCLCCAHLSVSNVAMFLTYG